MSTHIIVRGNIVTISFTPLDVNGNIVSPQSVNATFAYGTLAGKQKTTMSMAAPVAPVTAWTTTFDTTPVLPGTVKFYVASVGPASAGKGEFDVVSNVAGPSQ